MYSEKLLEMTFKMIVALMLANVLPWQIVHSEIHTEKDLQQFIQYLKPIGIVVRFFKNYLI